MIIRTYDLDTICKAVALYGTEIKGFYPQEWLDNLDN